MLILLVSFIFIINIIFCVRCSIIEKIINQNRKDVYIIILFGIIGCLIMGIVDAIISPTYTIKSIIKIILFIILPTTCYLLNKELSLKKIFIFNKKSMLFSISLGVGIYIFIIGSYLLLGRYFDFSNVTKSLQNNIGVNKDNFIFVSLYISFINSLLEEFFFRGFSFLTLKTVATRKLAYIFSSTIFALYHIAMMIKWFQPFLLLLIILALFIGGCLFNYLNEKTNNIYTSWMVHMFANFAINTIGFILFQII